MSSGESSPPYEPSQPATASMSTPNDTRISLGIAFSFCDTSGAVRRDGSWD